MQMVLNQNNKSMFERKFVMKNIENFAISDAALEQVTGGVELKSSTVKKVLAYTGIVLGGGLAFSASFAGGAVLGEKLKPIDRAMNFIKKRRESKKTGDQTVQGNAPVETLASDKKVSE